MADVAGLVDLPSFDHEEETLLVVGHAETIPSILSGLGVFETVEIGQADYTNLLVVAPGRDDGPLLLRLRMP